MITVVRSIPIKVHIMHAKKLFDTTHWSDGNGNLDTPVDREKETALYDDPEGRKKENTSKTPQESTMREMENHRRGI